MCISLIYSCLHLHCCVNIDMIIIVWSCISPISALFRGLFVLKCLLNNTEYICPYTSWAWVSWTKSSLPSVNFQNHLCPALFRIIFFVLSLLQCLEVAMLPAWKSCVTQDQLSLTLGLKDAKKRRKHLKKCRLINDICHLGSLYTHLRLLLI